jgi:hypothetical protein
MKSLIIVAALTGLAVTTPLSAQGRIIPTNRTSRQGCTYNQTGSTVGDVVFGRNRTNTNDCNTSGNRANGSWYQVGQDRNGNTIYERRVTDGNGNVIVQRARRDSFGNMSIISSRNVGNNNGSLSNNRRRGDGDNDGDDDDQGNNGRRVNRNNGSLNNGSFNRNSGNGNSERHGRGRGKGHKGRD